MELVRLWEITLRRKNIFLATFAIIFATVMVATFLTPSTYEARAKVLVSSSDSLSSLMSALGLPQFDSSRLPSSSGLKGQEEVFATEIALATIRPVSERLISELNLSSPSGDPLTAKHLTSSSLINNFRPRPYVRVEQFEDTDMLEIIARSADPEEAVLMVNRLAELFIEDRLAQTRDDYRAARLFIEDQVSGIKENYFVLLNERKDFMVEAQTVDLEAEIRNLLELVSVLKKEFDDNEITIAEAKQSIAMVESKIGGKGYVSGTLAETLESRLAEVLIDVSGDRILTATIPDIEELNRRVGTVQDIIRGKADFVMNEEAVSLFPVYGDLVRDLKDAWISQKVAETKRGLLRTHIERYEAELIEIPVKSIRDSEIELALNVQQSVYSTVLEYLTQVGVAEAMTISDIKMIEPATPSDTSNPVFPRPLFAGAFGLSLGLFWAFALAFFAEYVDNTVKDPEDLSGAGLSVLGTIQRSPRNPLLSGLDPNDPVYESYCRAVAGISFTRVDDPPKKLLVTSIDPGAGSSTVLVNLGIVYAREGKKVLLIDTDLRRASLHEMLELGNERGLTDLLLDDISSESVIQEAQIPGLSVLSSGPTPPDPGLLLKSPRLEAIIKRLADEFDVLLFDSAPLLIKSDSILLMNNLDGMILVAKSESTTRPAIAKANSILEGAKITPVGIILNCFEQVSIRGRMRNGVSHS